MGGITGDGARGLRGEAIRAGAGARASGRVATARRALPRTLTREWAAAAAAEAIGRGFLAERLFKRIGGTTAPRGLDRTEAHAFLAVLRNNPEPGAASIGDVGEPRGSIDAWLSEYGRLVAPSSANDAHHAPRRTDFAGAARPDAAARLRGLIDLVERCASGAPSAVAPPTCVALLLWLRGHCRPRPARDLEIWRAERPSGRSLLADGAGDQALPSVEEVQRWVVTGSSIHRLAAAIDARARAPGSRSPRRLVRA